jgi:hypothetical protein
VYGVLGVMMRLRRADGLPISDKINTGIDNSNFTDSNSNNYKNNKCTSYHNRNKSNECVSK